MELPKLKSKWNYQNKRARLLNQFSASWKIPMFTLQQHECIFNGPSINAISAQFEDINDILPIKYIFDV